MYENIKLHSQGCNLIQRECIAASTLVFPSGKILKHALQPAERHMSHKSVLLSKSLK